MALVWFAFITLLLLSGFYFVLAIYLLIRTARLRYAAEGEGLKPDGQDASQEIKACGMVQ